jgi:hypothetical protein
VESEVQYEEAGSEELGNKIIDLELELLSLALNDVNPMVNGTLLQAISGKLLSSGVNCVIFLSKSYA